MPVQLGLWQFMSHTGKNYGLERNFWHEDRRDVVKSTDAALRYLDTLQEMFDGDWLLVMAAYNVGEHRVLLEIKKNLKRNKSTNFSALKLPYQTRHHVPKIDRNQEHH